MTDLISFRIYRTEAVELNGEAFTLQLAQRTDRDEYALFALNEATLRREQRFYSSEIAALLAKSTGSALADEVHKLLASHS